MVQSRAVPHSLDERTPGSGAPLRAVGLDPTVGTWVSLLGLFLMGAGGARAQQHLFRTGVIVAIGGAALCVLRVALSALKNRVGAGR